MDKLLYVILGGAIGSGFRYGVSVWMQSFSISFPFAILTVNVTGSFFIGPVSYTHLTLPTIA